MEWWLPSTQPSPAHFLARTHTNNNLSRNWRKARPSRLPALHPRPRVLSRRDLPQQQVRHVLHPGNALQRTVSTFEFAVSAERLSNGRRRCYSWCIFRLTLVRIRWARRHLFLRTHLVQTSFRILHIAGLLPTLTYTNAVWISLTSTPKRPPSAYEKKHC
jgi:hypothetical protein